MKTTITRAMKLRILLPPYSQFVLLALSALKWRSAFSQRITSKTIDVAAGLGTEVHVIGVLVHIERQDRRATGEGMGNGRLPIGL